MFNCMVGVRQGENLSPQLFSIYLRDLESFLSNYYEGLKYFNDQAFNNTDEGSDVHVYIKLFILLYADDIVILAETEADLQAAIIGMHEYCNIWELDINTAKTKVIVFSRGKIRNKPKIMYGDVLLDVVDDYTYLGIVFNYNGSFTKTIRMLYVKASNAMFTILRKAKKLYLDIDTQIQLFNTLVVPIMLYGCEVWGNSDIQLLERLQLRFCKIMLGVHPKRHGIWGSWASLSFNLLLNVE
ncbi:hypothetical protein SNE40_004061 [Patella caerulea]|uniref:Reverse transcriptase domain-containing protein n=1 Tax=Patella caerulea TaxID=87958 RepID=A0AAN8Q0X6_PATCE